MKTTPPASKPATDKHPDVLAFEKFEKENPVAFDADSLVLSHNPDHYLRNRLARAFRAGIAHARAEKGAR